MTIRSNVVQSFRTQHVEILQIQLRSVAMMEVILWMDTVLIHRLMEGNVRMMVRSAGSVHAEVENVKVIIVIVIEEKSAMGWVHVYR
jgi:hypothetical protein